MLRPCLQDGPSVLPCRWGIARAQLWQHHGLQAGLHSGPFRIEKAEVNGMPDAPAGRDHVIAEGTLLARSDPKNRRAGHSFSESVFNSTRMQPSVSNACSRRRYFASVFAAVRCHSGATHVHPISTR